MGSPLWAPNPGAQTAAFESEADFTFYGGAAGGGKSDLLIGLSTTRHKRSIIFRREYEELKALVDRSEQIIGEYGRYSSKDKIWQMPSLGRKLEFGAVQHEKDKKKFQGRPHDLVAFDELPEFSEAQFRFLCGWLRTTDPAQRCRVVGAGNPPMSAEGDWVIRFWAPWLDPDHPNPAEPGELRWFAVIDGDDKEVSGPEAFEHDGETISPKSRTFIPARVEDNPYYMATDYVSTLQALPEPLRSMLRHGRFDARIEDDPWQVIPSEWVDLAQKRWQEQRKPDVPMSAVGVDVAQGGSAETVLSPRYAHWFDELQPYPGIDTKDGPAVAALVVANMRDGAQANIDTSGGWGNSAYDHLKGLDVPVQGLNGAEKSDGRSRDGQLGFINKRAEWYWRMREALDPAYGEDLCLPPDRQLRADLCAPRWRLSARGIQIELKDDIIKRIGRSPDRGDAAIYSLAAEGTAQRKRKRGANVQPDHSDYNPHAY